MEKAPISSILVVDNNEQHVMAIQKALQSTSVSLVSVSSAQAAWRLLLQKEFAVILLALKMPMISGLELARLIRIREKTKHVPLIFLTAYNGEAEMTRMISQDCELVDYLPTPINPAILRAMVKALVETH